MASIPPPVNALAVFGLGGKLSDAQKTKISELLFNKLGNRACEMCAHTSWAIGDNVVQAAPLILNRVSVSYSADFLTLYPSVHLVCTNCGNTKLFLLSILGFNPFEVLP